jgi:hypothetical protein
MGSFASECGKLKVCLPRAYAPRMANSSVHCATRNSSQISDCRSRIRPSCRPITDLPFSGRNKKRWARRQENWHCLTSGTSTYALPTLISWNGNRRRELDAMLLESDPLRRATDPKVNERNRDVTTVEGLNLIQVADSKHSSCQIPAQVQTSCSPAADHTLSTTGVRESSRRGARPPQVSVRAGNHRF